MNEIADQPRFGSAQRAGATSAEYQLDRLRKLNGFNAELLAAYQRRLAQRVREGLRAYEGNRWLEAQRATWEREAQARGEALHQQRAGIEEMQKSRANLAAALAELKTWTADVEKARDWTEGQRQLAADQLERALEAGREMRQWNEELQKGKDWHEQQARNWREQAEQAQKTIEELRAWITQLESIRDWNVARREHLEQAYGEWQKQFVARALLRVGLLKGINGT